MGLPSFVNIMAQKVGLELFNTNREGEKNSLKNYRGLKRFTTAQLR
jgi:hypothetical protein